MDIRFLVFFGERGLVDGVLLLFVVLMCLNIDIEREGHIEGGARPKTATSAENEATDEKSSINLDYFYDIKLERS